MRKRDVHRLMEELEDLFEHPWKTGARLTAARPRGFRPPLDVYRTEDPPELTVVVELAGVDPETVELLVGEGVLLIAGERKRPGCGQRVVYHHMEIGYGRFERRVRLSDPLDVENAQATYERGILTVVLPIASKPARQARIPVTLGGRP